MVGLSRLRGGGLLLVLALLPLALDGKPLEEAPTAPSRIIPFSRPVRKQSQAVLDPMVHPERPAGSGDDGDSRRLEGLAKEALGDGCFGQRIDRICNVSGMGCNHVRTDPAPTALARIIPFSRPVRKESRAALDRMQQPG
uniref:Natriuretic peptide Mc-NP n=1 Tax=Micrurus corallinus TaxID=54390 RepID=VNP32_MICCO|nr:RecName: Full=Natriuretic peptide Mc-NP; AltName: Full=Micrurus natriuretic peptide; Short=MNP; AltName: Full=Putative natriuretic peptide 3A32; Flags: Precursor [Micrurus corallinus]AAC60341.1 natriuretic peptide [Micrurus corallinus]